MRLLQCVRLDMKLQARNQLYRISVLVSIVAAAALAWLSPADYLPRSIPMAVLLFAGGSTLLYVVAMVLLEKSDGVLDALSVSPLRPREYLSSKVITLTGIAVLEAVLLTAIALGWHARTQSVALPTLWFLIGTICLGALHVLVGIIVVVRYERISGALMPMSLLAMVGQLPAFRTIGALDSDFFLAIPTAAPTMLVRASFEPLTVAEWSYALSYTVVALAGLGFWSMRAYRTFIIERAG